jgi:asparagine synthase (glutamine-hydrolysing)
MCGIAGFSGNTQHLSKDTFAKALETLNKRGPDHREIFQDGNLFLGHARLSIIDTSNNGHQPMSDPSGRYTIVFNGEIFNYEELRKTYVSDVNYTSTSDTEVLLHLLIRKRKDAIALLNGFFAFAFYDKLDNTLLIARDRYGVKPLLYAQTEAGFAFASEMKALLQLPVKKEIDFDTLFLYLQLNYVPFEHSMLKGVMKVKPGNYLQLKGTTIVASEPYYTIPFSPKNYTSLSYEESQKELRSLLEGAVERRLVSDVPLGAFLSGGIDSSIIVSIAARKVKRLNTFSIGFKDNPYFDETQYAKLVADRYKTNHTVFSISNEAMYENIFDLLDYIDEPFADSSAIAVYSLCQQTRTKATVSLSGDGGDELFAGYNKHKAMYRFEQMKALNPLFALATPIWNLFPQSRNSKMGNVFRQLSRYSEGAKLKADERYWRWCVFADENTTATMFGKPMFSEAVIKARKQELYQLIDESDLNTSLLADMKMVLPNDMLTKVDLMSMANSLEVRTPLLDYTVVNFAFQIPFQYKLRNGVTKSILKDAFRADLPEELFNRGKKGFEVPLTHWLKTGLWSLIDEDLLSERFVTEQGIFNYDSVRDLKQQLQSNNPGDAHARIWGLLAFQYWYRKYFSA